MSEIDYNFENCYKKYLDFQKTRVKLSTMSQKQYKFKYMCDLYSLDIRNLTSCDISSWSDNRIENGSTKKYTNSLIKELRAFYSWCQQNSYNVDNPAKKVKLYKVADPFHKIWDVNEFKKFLTYINDDKYRISYQILFYTGIRSGELLALEINDFYDDKMRIDKTYNVQHKIVTSTKTYSARECLLPDFLVDEIQKYIENNNLKCNDFLLPRNFAWHLRKRIHDICKNNNLKDIKLHELRHSCVSVLLNNGFNPVDVATYLGMKDPNRVLKTYGHMYKKRKLMIKTLFEDIHKNSTL